MSAETNETPDVHIIDCDAHLTEPPDLWSARVPARMADKMPVLKTVDGHTAWYLGEEVWASLGGNTIQTGGKKVRGEIRIQPWEIIDKSSWSVTERLDLLDKSGIWAQILYPNGIGFASNHVFAIDDTEQRTTVLQVYNDFLAEVQNDSDGRLFPQALLPIWDMNFTVKEMTRLIDKGIRGFTLSDKPEMIGLPELSDTYFDPMWDVFNESGAVANFHIGAGRSREEVQSMRNPERAIKGPNGAAVSSAWRSLSRRRQFLVSSAQGGLSNIRIITNLCVSNIFDRFPKLKVVSAESGIGWIPFLLESLEFLYDEMIVGDEERLYAKHRPTDYFREHIYVMFWYEELAPRKLLDEIGTKNILVETDIPHPSCLFPGPVEHFTRVLSGQDPTVVRDILQDNAATLYKLDLPSAG